MHDLRATKPALTRRPDFAHFWQETLADLASVPAEPQLSEARIDEAGCRVAEVSFHSLGDVTIHGYLLRPITSPPAGGRPLVVTTHGYNSQCDVEGKSRHTQVGADVFCFDVRGFGRSKSAVEVDQAGYILTGIEDPKTSILRGAFCDFVRGAEVARQLLSTEAPDSRPAVAFQGSSFAGALATIAQALTSAADLLAVGVPTFGWTEGRLNLVKRGSGLELRTYLDANPGRREVVLNTLSYFDTMNFADRLVAPAIFGVGINDEVVPPESVFAVINHVHPAPRVMEFPFSHTTREEEKLWRQFDQRWTDTLLELHSAQSEFTSKNPPEPD